MGGGFEPPIRFAQECLSVAVYAVRENGGAQWDAQNFAELRDVVACWSRLTPPIRSAVVALVRVANGGASS